jgi:hypothetical protein
MMPYSGALIALLICLSIRAAETIMASPFPFELTHSDGSSTGQIHIRGGPGTNSMEDADGFTICSVDVVLNGTAANKRKKKNYYYCVENGSGDLIPRKDLKVGTSNPAAAGLKKRVRQSLAKALADCGEFCSSNGFGRRLSESEQGQRKLAAVGQRKNLVVLMRFSDHASRSLPTVAQVDELMNSGGTSSIIPTGSVKKVYLDNSYGQLTVTSTVANWVTIDYTEAFCANGNSGLSSVIHTCIGNALTKVQAAGIRFSDFDDGNGFMQGIAILHSGYGAECK